MKKLKNLTEKQIDTICHSAFNCFHCPLCVNNKKDDSDIWLCSIIGNEEIVEKELNKEIDYQSLLKETRQKKKEMKKEYKG